VQLMTAPAALKAHRGVLERERTALIAVAAETARLIDGEHLRHGWPEAAMWIVAIDAAHRPLRQFVMVRPLKLCPNIGVTTRALLVNGRELPEDHAVWSIGVNLVA